MMALLSHIYLAVIPVFMTDANESFSRFITVPPVKEPVKSAAKERQCLRYHRSNESEESATRASVKGCAWSGGRTETDPTTPARRGQLGTTSAGLEERRRGPPHKTQSIESAKESTSA